MPNENFAVMRHAMEHCVTMIIPESEQEICRDVTRRLAEKIPGKKVKIFHSYAKRAKSTGELVKAQLVELGFAVDDCTPLDWLEDRFTNRDIAKVLPEGNEYFCIFISHEPELHSYLGDCGIKARIDNCNIISHDFIITRRNALS